MTSFSEFGLARPILLAIEHAGHETPTPIQADVIPQVMAGRDVLGLAQTGSGKTAAFALPILHMLARRGDIANPKKKGRGKSRPSHCRSVILAPTRELAAQIKEQFDLYGTELGLQTGLIIGGVPVNKQVAMVRSGAEILIATPGRLVDLMKRGVVKLDAVEAFVMDEVDQMLDLGFIHDIRTIIGALPVARQNIFLSATMPKVAQRLADEMLEDPIRIEITRQERPKIEESVHLVSAKAKPAMLVQLVKQSGFERGLVFTRTKYGADKVAKVLKNEGIVAFAIHGDRNQSQRKRALAAFREGRAPILVATDIAARGIDVPDVTHVVNYDLPNVPETYVHRIGRTGRAGATGIAVSFCAPDERVHLRLIERRLKRKVPIVENPDGAVLSKDSDAQAASLEAEASRPRRTAPKKSKSGPDKRAPKKKPFKKADASTGAEEESSSRPPQSARPKKKTHRKGPSVKKVEDRVARRDREEHVEARKQKKRDSRRTTAEKSDDNRKAYERRTSPREGNTENGSDRGVEHSSHRADGGRHEKRSHADRNANARPDDSRRPNTRSNDTRRNRQHDGQDPEQRDGRRRDGERKNTGAKTGQKRSAGPRVGTSDRSEPYRGSRTGEGKPASRKVDGRKSGVKRAGPGGRSPAGKGPGKGGGQNASRSAPRPSAKKTGPQARRGKSNAKPRSASSGPSRRG